MRAFLAFVVSFVASSCFAQSPDGASLEGMAGTFYVSVDDSARIYLDGKEIHQAGLNESHSAEVKLKTGQHLVVQLVNFGGAHRFMLVFVSRDRQKVVSFKYQDFKIVPDIGITDFTSANYEKWPQHARRESYKVLLPVKSHSEWVWARENDASWPVRSRRG